MKPKYFTDYFFLLIVLSSMSSGCLKPEYSVKKLKKQYTNKTSEFVKIQGMDVHYRDEGPKRAPCILLLHDIGASLHTYDNWADTLQLEYRVVRLDLPGFGLTGPSPKGDYSMKAYRDFLNEFMDELNVKRCYIVGNGLGGRLAWELTLAYPKRVRRMVLMSASGFPVEKSNLTPMEKMAGSSGLSKTRFRWFTPKKVVKSSVKKNFGDKDRASKETMKRQYDLLRRKGNRKAFIDRVTTEDYDRTRRIKDIEIPVMIMWGTEDKIIPIEHASYFHKILSNSKLKFYTEAGHYLMEEMKEGEIVNDLMSFLNYR